MPGMGRGSCLADCGRRLSTQDGGRTLGSVPSGAADSQFGEGPVGACDTLTGPRRDEHRDGRALSHLRAVIRRCASVL